MISRKLGRKIANRKSLMRNLAASLILFEAIETTAAKAKSVRGEVDRLISLGKKQDLPAYRKLLAYFYDKNVAKKIYDELSKRYDSRNSGFVKMYHLKNRLGDNAEMIRLELIDRKVFVAPKKIVKEKTAEEKPSDIKTEKKIRRAERKIQKLTKTQEKSGVVTQIRTKAARKTGV
ncbi:MAG: 50S ribosomal protein L17 [Candidatus Berkelbacteria bacterium]|nr:50S ribosomal protein L17 [Candidatus Berkelbacteria bacterium]